MIDIPFFSKEDIVEKSSAHNVFEELSKRQKETAEKYDSVMKLATSLAIRLSILGFKFDGGLDSLHFSHDCGEFLSNELHREETDSSSDEEIINKQSFHHRVQKPHTPMDLSDQYYCFRSVVRSNWFWLQTEILKANNSIKNLEKILFSYNTWKKSQPFVHYENFSSSAARTRPINRDIFKNRHSFINIASRKSARVISPWTDDTGIVDGTIRCSCNLPYSGPCILCCGLWNKVLDDSQSYSRLTLHRPRYTSEFDSFVNRTVPLTAFVHPKLSSLADIPASIRLESRLVAPNVSTVPTRPIKSNAVTLSDRKFNQVGPFSIVNNQSQKPDCLTRFIFDLIPSEETELLESNDNSSTWLNSSETVSRPNISYKKSSWLTETRRQSASQNMAKYQNKLQKAVQNDIPAPGWRYYDPFEDNDLEDVLNSIMSSNKKPLDDRHFEYKRYVSSCENPHLKIKVSGDASCFTEVEDTSDNTYLRLHEQEQEKEHARRCGRLKPVASASTATTELDTSAMNILVHKNQELFLKRSNSSEEISLSKRARKT